MSEALKKARKYPSLPEFQESDLPQADVAGILWAFSRQKVVAIVRKRDAALAAIDAEAKPVVRMLTDGEIADALSGYGMMAKQIQRKFAEVNGLTIGEQG